MTDQPIHLTTTQARRLWMRAQRLDEAAPFGDGPAATTAAVAHLGYVQIDTINVIERCHHHILFTRIPSYQRADLQHAQATEKTIFEYWTHALAYVPSRDIRFFLPSMQAYRKDERRPWFGQVTAEDTRKVMRLLRTDGPQTIRDIDDDDLVEKTHAWGSRKPSKKALQLAFYCGDVTIAARDGMLKRYDLTARHFGWEAKPKAATATEILDYKLDRALRAQGLVSLDSICHLEARNKPAVRARIEARVRRGALRLVAITGAEKIEHWATPAALDTGTSDSDRVHILSPFDPLIIQRKRLKLLFGYDHLFEAYVPKEKRKIGYFALPVLIGDRIAAVLDLKADRAAQRLLIQNWVWTDNADKRADRRLINAELDRFAAFQFGS